MMATLKSVLDNLINLVLESVDYFFYSSCHFVDSWCDGMRENFLEHLGSI